MANSGPKFFGGAVDTRGGVGAKVATPNPKAPQKAGGRAKTGGGSKAPSGWPAQHNYALSEGLMR